MQKNAINVDNIIQRLVAVRGGKPGKIVNLTDFEIKSLLVTVRQILLNQPMLLHLEAPVKIVGDIHGQYYDLLRIFSFFGYPPTANYLFLGDYVDRGQQGIETFCLLICYKIKYPENFFILRGNHESEWISKHYGFYDQCKRRYSVELWKVFTQCFHCLPIAAVVDDKIFCVHGGLSPELQNIELINQIQRPTQIPDKGLLCDLLWSDPDNKHQGWGENPRGISYTFGQDVVQFIIMKFNLDLICRGHQVVADGYQFFAKKKLATIFSAPNYMGAFDNSGGVMCVNQQLTCSFQILKPTDLVNNHPVSSHNRPGTPSIPQSVSK